MKQKIHTNKTLTEYQLLQTANRRLTLTPHFQNKLTRLEKGKQGETMVIEFIQKYGHPDWRIMQNLWLDPHSPFETDILVIGKMGALILEVKNYDGIFRYENGICYLNNNPMSNNVVSQTQKLLINYNYLNNHWKLFPQTKAALVFIGDHCEVDIVDPPSEIQIISRNQLKQYLKTTAKLENASPARQSADKSLQRLKKLSIPNPLPLGSLEAMTHGDIPKGIQCIHCGSFKMERTLRRFYCKCGKTAGFKETILTNLNDYCILNHQRNHFTCQEISEYLSNEISSSSIFRMLNKNYESEGNRNKRYINPYQAK